MPAIPRDAPLFVGSVISGVPWTWPLRGRDLDRSVLLRDEHPSARQEPEVDRRGQARHDRGPIELGGRRDVAGDGHRAQRVVAAVGLVDDAAGGDGQIGAAGGVRGGIGDQRRHHGVGSGVDRHDGVVGARHEQQTPVGCQRQALGRHRGEFDILFRAGTENGGALVRGHPG